jgi:hypothetical protein
LRFVNRCHAELAKPGNCLRVGAPNLSNDRVLHTVILGPGGAGGTYPAYLPYLPYLPFGSLSLIRGNTVRALPSKILCLSAALSPLASM